MQLLTRRFKQLYERVYITTICYIYPTIRIAGQIIQMYIDLKEIKRLKSLQKAEAYLEPKQTSMMELFMNILNSLLFLQ